MKNEDWMYYIVDVKNILDANCHLNVKFQATPLDGNN